MKKIADLLVTVALLCIVPLFQLVPAQGRELTNPVVRHSRSIPHKCMGPATELIPETSVAARRVANGIDANHAAMFNFALVGAHPSFYHLLQIPNPIDDTRFFVRQHYLDFLRREPDTAGWDFWSGQITACGSDAACIDRKRVDVSRAFFFDGNFVASQFPINPNLGTPRGADVYNRAFIRQCYLTYLRREPDQGGYDFWLANLTSYGSPTPNLGYDQLIRAFLVSIEYRARFVSPPC